MVFGARQRAESRQSGSHWRNAHQRARRPRTPPAALRLWRAGRPPKTQRADVCCWGRCIGRPQLSGRRGRAEHWFRAAAELVGWPRRNHAGELFGSGVADARICVKRAIGLRSPLAQGRIAEEAEAELAGLSQRSERCSVALDELGGGSACSCGVY